MDIGKFPPELLERLLRTADTADARVVLGPGVGEDAAVLDFGDRLLVAKSDPVTFAVDRAGWYAVQVCANDVACTGATPRWFLATLLVPERFDADDAARLFEDVVAGCRELNVTLVGGHSEVTAGIERPIVAGTMLGEVETKEFITTAGARAEDEIIVTKGVAIEGTAILARDCAGDLRAAGIDERSLAAGAALLDGVGISVVRDAEAAARLSVHSLHDVTEGGLATALHEVAKASGLGLAVDGASIPVLPETAAVCDALGLDPLGLLGSGALVATLGSGDAPVLLKALAQAGIEAWRIGWMTAADAGRMLTKDGGTVPLPEFRRDELARYFSLRSTCGGSER